MSNNRYMSAIVDASSSVPTEASSYQQGWPSFRMESFIVYDAFMRRKTDTDFTVAPCKALVDYRTDAYAWYQTSYTDCTSEFVLHNNHSPNLKLFTTVHANYDSGKEPLLRWAGGVSQVTYWTINGQKSSRFDGKRSSVNRLIPGARRRNTTLTDTEKHTR